MVHDHSNEDRTEDENHHRYRKSEQGAIAQKQDRGRKAADDSAAGGIDRNPLDGGHCAECHQDGMNAQKRHDYPRDQPND